MKRVSLLAGMAAALLALSLPANAQLASERAGAFYFGESEPGDGFIGSSDLSAIVVQMKSTSGSYALCEPPDSSIQDVDGDGFIGAGDKSIISQWIKNIWPALSGRAARLVVMDQSGLESSLDVMRSFPGDSLELSARAYDATNGNLRAGWGIVFTAASANPSCQPLLQGHNPFSMLTTRPDIIVATQVHAYTYRPTSPDDGWATVKLVSIAGCSNGDTIRIDTMIPDDTTAGVTGQRMPTSVSGPSFVISTCCPPPPIASITYFSPIVLAEGESERISAICTYSDLSSDDCTAVGGLICSDPTGDLTLDGCTVIAGQIPGPAGGSGSVTVHVADYPLITDLGSVVITNDDIIVSTLITSYPASVTEGGVVTYSVIRVWSDSYFEDLTTDSYCSDGCFGGGGSCTADQAPCGAAPASCSIHYLGADNEPIIVPVTNDDTIVSTLIYSPAPMYEEGDVITFNVTRTWSDSCTEDLTLGSSCSGGCVGADGVCTALQEPCGSAPPDCCISHADATNSPLCEMVINDEDIVAVDLAPDEVLLSDGDTQFFTCAQTWSDLCTESCLPSTVKRSGGCVGSTYDSGTGLYTAAGSPCTDYIDVTVGGFSDSSTINQWCIPGVHDHYAVNATASVSEGATITYTIEDIDTCGNATVVAGETASPSGDCANVGGSIPGGTVNVAGVFGFDADLNGWSATGAPVANIPAWAATPLGSFGSAAIRFPGTADATDPAANSADEAISYTADATDRTALHFTGTVCTCATDSGNNEFLDVQYNCGSGLTTLGSFAAGNNTNQCACQPGGAQRQTFDYTLPAACEGNANVVLQVRVRNGINFGANERNYVDNLLLTGVTPDQPGIIEIVADQVPCSAGGSCVLTAANIGGETVVSDTVIIVNDDAISSVNVSPDGPLILNNGDTVPFSCLATCSDANTENCGAALTDPAGCGSLLGALYTAAIGGCSDTVSATWGGQSDFTSISVLPPPCTLSMTCASPQPELVQFSCAVTYDDAGCTDTLALDASNTCASASVTDNGNGTGTYRATPSEVQGPGDCVAAVQLAADGKTASQSVTVDDVNSSPSVILNCPSSVNDNSAFTCNATYWDTDVPINFLSLSINWALTTCAGVTLSGSTVNVPAQGEQWCGSGCDVSVRVTDNGSPILSATATKFVPINPINRPPTVTVTCTDSVNEDAQTTCAATKSDPDCPAQTVTLSVDPTSTCTNLTLFGNTVVVPAQGESAGPGNCNVVIRATDSSLLTSTATDTIIINEVNLAPVITNLPYAAGPAESSYDVNHVDIDLPPNTITYSIQSETCISPIVINPSTGEVGWTCSAVETCTVSVRATDNGSPTLYDQEDLTINCIPCCGVEISYVWPLRATTDDRFRLNAHPDQHLTVVMSPTSGIPTSVTAACGPIGFTCANPDADLDWDCAPTSNFTSYYATAGGGTEYNCTVTATNGASSDSTPITPIAPMRVGLATVSATGGMGGGYVGGNVYHDATGSGAGTVADGIVNLTVINEDDRAAINGKAYVQVVQGGVTRNFFTNSSGVAALTLLAEDIDELTIGYKCGSERCEGLLHQDGAQPNRSAYYDHYRFKTWTGVDASNLVLPLPLMDGAREGRNRATITGTITSTAFNNYIGPRISETNTEIRPLFLPSIRLRAVLVALAPKDPMQLSGGLDSLLMTPDSDISVAVCIENSPVPKIDQVLRTKLPPNLVLPELIRNDWKNPCNSFTTNPSYTRYRVWTETPGSPQIVWAIGAWVNMTYLMNFVEPFDPYSAPIYINAIGMHGLSINSSLRTAPYSQAINLSANLEQDLRENWTNDPLGYDFDTAVDRKYLLNVMPMLPYDPARVAARTWGVSYRLPNLTDTELMSKYAVTSWDQRFYRRDVTMASGGDFGPAIGLGFTGFRRRPKIDDAEFTTYMVGYFQSTGSRLGMRNLKYWSGSTGDSEVGSLQQATGTNTWTNLTWGTTTLDWDPVDTGGPTNYAAIIALTRGDFYETCGSDLSKDPGDDIYMYPFKLVYEFYRGQTEGFTAAVHHIGDPAMMGNETIAATDFLNMPSPVSPPTDNYVYPAPQWSNTIGASIPRNRNGEMWPDRTVTSANSLPTSGGRYYVEFTRTGLFRTAARSAPDVWTTALRESAVTTLEGATITGWRRKVSARTDLYSTGGLATGTAGVFKNVIDITAFVTAAKVPYRQVRWLSQGIQAGDSLVIMTRKAGMCNARLYICRVDFNDQITVAESAANCASGTYADWTALACDQGTRNIQNYNHIRYRIVRRKTGGECQIDDWNADQSGNCLPNSFWEAEGPGPGTGNIRAYVPQVSYGYTSLNGVTGYVPNLWEGMEAATQLEWAYGSVIFNTDAVTSGGMGRKFNYQNRDFQTEARKIRFISSDLRYVRYQ